MDQLLPFLIILLAVALIWLLIKLLLKLTAKIFSCGCIVLLIIAVLVFLFSGDHLPFLR